MCKFIICLLVVICVLVCQASANSHCGVPVGMSKIVGGEAVPSLRYPWYVALVQTDVSDPPLSVSCGGSLITNRHVLTAAHCFPRIQGMRPEQLYRAVFALVNRCGQGRFDSSTLQKVDINPSFNPNTLQGDVAIITLPKRVQFMPICLPPKHSTVTGPALVIGFGSTMAKSNEPCILQEATVNILTRKQCKMSALESQFSSLPGIYCAGVPGGGVDSCNGDSGGPLQTASSSGIYTIQGIVSFGEGCARKNLPGVYTQVSFYRDFIDKVIHSAPIDEPPEDWDYSTAEPEAENDQEPTLVPVEPLNPLKPLVPLAPLAHPRPPNVPNRPSLASFLQAWFQGFFRPLANMTTAYSSSGSRFPTPSGPISHRPITSIQAIIQGIFNRRRNGFGDQSMIHG